MCFGGCKQPAQKDDNRQVDNTLKELDMFLSINGETFTVKLEDNKTSQQLLNLFFNRTNEGVKRQRKILLS